MNQVVTMQPKADAIERVLIAGDLSKLSAEDRISYYMRVCESAGLNPLTQPFDYIMLSGKLTLYAKKGCTDQLRTIHKISVVSMEKDESEGILTVTAKVSNADGRTDVDMGSVNIGGLKGEARANAIMKASTKAKRRATLSICGLGLLDETELETIQNVAPAPPAEAGRRSNVVTNPTTGKKIDTENARNQRPEWERFTDTVQGFIDARDDDGLRAWFTSDKIAEYVAGWVFKDQAEEHFEKAIDEIAARERA